MTTETLLGEPKLAVPLANYIEELVALRTNQVSALALYPFLLREELHQTNPNRHNASETHTSLPPSFPLVMS